jgi:hypothetical protein
MFPKMIQFLDKKDKMEIKLKILLRLIIKTKHQ